MCKPPEEDTCEDYDAYMQARDEDTCDYELYVQARDEKWKSNLDNYIMRDPY